MYRVNSVTCQTYANRGIAERLLARPSWQQAVGRSESYCTQRVLGRQATLVEYLGCRRQAWHDGPKRQDVQAVLRMSEERSVLKCNDR